ncbi:hypothetical protein IWW38_000674 [Coemansia aciculifera]|uniref:Uncharacterized protein n=1 Tax=Coemansia aciculifera TaxID=417176 RepID=A0ACC1MA99_9FUNG|nr:hypothetical protein IWW38_000674 [Coemansia aciculifera]
MTHAKEEIDTDKKQQALARYLEGDGSSFDNNSGGGGGSSNRDNNRHFTEARAAPTDTTMIPTPATEREAIPNDLPPAYSFSDPNMHAGMPPQFSAALTGGSLDVYQDLKVDQKRASEMVATKAFAFDRPVYIHTSNISSTTLVVEPDTKLGNTDSIVVIAQITSQLSGLDNKCNVTATVNELNEYDFFVCSTASMWSIKPISCRFVVRVPSAHACSHPGIRAEFTNGRADMSYINNINFGFIDLKTTCGDVNLTHVRGGIIRASTTRGVFKANNVVAAELCEMLTTNSKVVLVDVRAKQVITTTNNSSITLTTVSGESIIAETTHGKVDCTNVAAINVKLSTTNSSIDTSHVEASNLYLNTRNAKIEGTWRIKNVLDVVTTNSRINGTILLQDPLEPVTIRLSTTNSKIQAYLPTDSFRGEFDIKTSNSKATVKAQRKDIVDSPPIRFTIDDKSFKRGTIGPGHSVLHQLAASTSNSAIEIRLV